MSTEKYGKRGRVIQNTEDRRGIFGVFRLDAQWLCTWIINADLSANAVHFVARCEFHAQRANEEVLNQMRRLLQTSGSDWALTIIRVTLGIVYFPHGAQKLFGWFGGRGFSGTITSYAQLYHLPAVAVVLVIAAEFLGSLGLIFGFLTRFDAFAIALDMLGAIKLVTLQNGFFMNWAGKQHGEGIEFQILVIGMAIALMWKGAGALSLDRLLLHSTGSPKTAPGLE